jgi:hypothetical protein
LVGDLLLVQDLRVTKKKPAAQPQPQKKKVVQPAFHRVTSAAGLLRSYNTVVAEDPGGAAPDLEAVVTVLDALGALVEGLPAALTFTMRCLEGIRDRLVADADDGVAETLWSAADEIEAACSLLRQALPPLDRAFEDVESLQETP